MQVITHIAERLSDLHAAGYVHRDIKPGNVMWLPRKKRWTLIDFGCVARSGEQAPTGFSFTYAAPETLLAHMAGARSIHVSEAIDAWSVGILAIEIFTGQPVFNIFQGSEQVCPLIFCVAFFAVLHGSTEGSRRFEHVHSAGVVPVSQRALVELQYQPHLKQSAILDRQFLTGFSQCSLVR